MFYTWNKWKTFYISHSIASPPPQLLINHGASFISHNHHGCPCIATRDLLSPPLQWQLSFTYTTLSLSLSIASMAELLQTPNVTTCHCHQRRWVPLMSPFFDLIPTRGSQVPIWFFRFVVFWVFNLGLWVFFFFGGFLLGGCWSGLAGFCFLVVWCSYL